MSKLATAFVEIRADDSKFVRGMRGIKTKLTRAMRGLQRIGKRLAIGVSVAGVAAAAGIGLAVRAAIKQEEAEARLEGVIKATGGAAGFTANELKKMASELQKVTTFGDETTLVAMAMLATFRDIKGDVFRDATKAAQDMSIIFGTSLQSSVLQLGKALNDPIRGLTMLQRVGIQFTDSQRDLIKSLVDSGKLMQAQKVVLDELTGQFGGAAEAAANTFGGRLQQLKNDFGDLVEEIGFAFIPALEGILPIAKTVLTGIAGFLDTMVNDWRTLWDIAMKVTEVVWDQITARAGASIDAMVRGFFELRDNIKEVFQDIVAIAMAATQAIASAVEAVFSGKDPGKAFVESFEASLATFGSGRLKKVGDAMSKEFSESFARGVDDQLPKDLAELESKLEGDRRKRKQAADESRAKLGDALQARGLIDPDEPAKKEGATAAAADSRRASFVGGAELAKQIQLSISGGGVQEKVEKNTKEAAKTLKQIDEGIKKIGDIDRVATFA